MRTPSCIVPARTMVPLAPRARVVPRTMEALKSRAGEYQGFASRTFADFGGLKFFCVILL
jgi:hypothetical protein